MPKDETLERRLTVVEAAVADLQRRIQDEPRPGHWLERFRGAFKDEPAFDEVIELGRAFRETGRIDDPEGR